MIICIGDNVTECKFTLVPSITRGCTFDFLHDGETEDNIMKLFDMLVIGEREITIRVNDEVLDNTKVDLETLRSIMLGYEQTVEFFNRGIYTMMQFILRNCKNEYPLSNGLAMKRYHWVDYIEGDIVHIPEDVSIFEILKKNAIKIEYVMKYGPNNAIKIFVAKMHDDYIDLEAVLKRFTINGMNMLCEDVTYSKNLGRLVVVGCAKLFRCKDGDMLKFSVEHEHMGKEFSKKVVSFNMDGHTRSIVINVEV